MNTEINLPVSELKTALGGLGKLINRKATLPVLGCVRVTRQAEGQITLQGTDLDGHATYQLAEAQPGEALDVLVPLEHLNKALKSNTSKEPVTLLCEGTETRLRYCLGNSAVTQPVNTVPVSEWPPVPEITGEFTPLQPGFAESLKQAMACASDDPTRFVLRGACLDARDPKAHYIVGTDGRFLFAANSFTFPLKESVIVPDSKFITGSGLLDAEPCFLSVQAGKKPDGLKHICLQNKQWRFVTREITGNYPNWKQVLPETNGWTTIKLSATAVEQMQKVIPMLPGRDVEHQPVRLRLNAGSLFVEGRGKEDREWTSVAITDVTIDGKAREIHLNREYLVAALKFGLSDLALLDELTPLICTKDGKRMVIMPVRPQAVTATKPEIKTETKSKAETKGTDMPKETQKLETPKPETQLTLLDQIEQIKEVAKTVIRDLNGLTETVKQIEKDKRAAEKEVENARSVLKKLQSVSL